MSGTPPAEAFDDSPVENIGCGMSGTSPCADVPKAKDDDPPCWNEEKFCVTF